MNYDRKYAIVVRNFLMRIVLTASLFFPLNRALVSAEEPPQETGVRGNMREVYRAFVDLQLYLTDEQKFSASKNQAEISKLLTTMSVNFHRTDSLGRKYMKEQGLDATLGSVQDMLTDVSTRFNEGKKSYALWRLRSLSSYCVTCHTRYEVSTDYLDEVDDKISDLPIYDRANFYFATRQFTKASEDYEKIVFDSDQRFERFNALRKWLVIYIRVHPQPKEAVEFLDKVLSSESFSSYEKQEITEWTKSLKAWQEEKPQTLNTEEAKIKEAERLIDHAKQPDDVFDVSPSFVDLLRASALLHGIHDHVSNANDTRRSKVLYLLGLIYSEMPKVFQSELPEIFLEQCIREFPGTGDAQQSFKRLKSVIELNYTGSQGLDIPADEKARLEELHGLAYQKLKAVPTRL